MIVLRVESVFFHLIVAVVVVDAHPLGTRPHRFADDDDAAAGLERFKGITSQGRRFTPRGGW